MKRMVSILMAIALVFSVSACGSSESTMEITIPEAYLEGTTQEELDEGAENGTYVSAVLNEDGSATLTLTQSQHKELMNTIKEILDESLDEMVESEGYPDIISIEVNDNYTDFKVTTRNESLTLDEMFSVYMYYFCGGIYSTFNGTDAENIHIEFINADSGEIINSVDSMGGDETAEETEDEE